MASSTRFTRRRLRELVRRPLLHPLLLLAGLLLAARASFAQGAQGALSGVVQDPGGGRIPRASVMLEQPDSGLKRTAFTDARGEFHFEFLAPAEYRLRVRATGFAERITEVTVSVSSRPTVTIVMSLQTVEETVVIDEDRPSLTAQPIETGSSVEKTIIGDRDLAEIPLAHRSFANIAYLAPMTEPVEPSDPTKARITAVSFAGSSGLNVDLSVDGGDNNDDFIGGFLQNYSPDAIQEFAVRTAQFDADTSRTNGGSVIISTRGGTNFWHGGLAGYFRDRALNARNKLDNPEPSPKQPFSRYNGVASFGGPIIRDKLFFLAALEYVDENASIAYSNQSLSEFQALAQLAAAGRLPGITSIGSVPSSVLTPFRDTLFSSRADWAQTDKSHWFLRAAFDRNHTRNDLIQQATLPSTGAFTRSNYFSILADNSYVFSPQRMGEFVFQASGFHHTKDRNSHLGEALAFPFSANFHTASGFETFGDNQFVTLIAAFPVSRDQQKYQFRYDVTALAGPHAVKFGANFIHEPVLRGALASDAEKLFVFGHDPSFYVANPAAPLDVTESDSPAQDGAFSQSLRRLGLYAHDSWRMLPGFTVNFGLRYDTTFGLFRASGRTQDQNPAVVALNALGISLAPGIPHDYRGAIAPRLGIAYAPGKSGTTVLRAGIGLYYNDLAQNGWVDAFRAVNNGSVGAVLGPGDQGAVIAPSYHSPYALQASAGIERQLSSTWRLNVHFEHQQGVHQYRRYEYVGGVTLPAGAPNISLFRADNRSRYDGLSFQAAHSFSHHFELNAHYTLASASTWGSTVAELFDYVNGVTDVRNPFGPGDHGPSGEDVRHRFVLSAVWNAPGRIEFATLGQFESARPFTMTTPVDLNGDGLSSNDRAVVNGLATTLDQFRGTPFYQTDLRVSREFKFRERFALRPFVEFFNLFNRSNPGNNFVTDLSALPTPVNNLANATALCLDPACTQTRPITSLRDLRVPAGALGDFFGPGTTVGIPFAAQLGLRFSF